eukprot:CAMPEP_0206489504 /NCGR_PEP_ID=MMETSP0324_2-20121206/43297_1 /ASSEMBLY_ACC=CAM_ASM_000836 /TAXON_ID=2866 /ORGANISM="Crypthecodinium cohnii, Strain Seligo" /LENGTH=50 /DNA_ID=CAMNT_0053969231 /DNA_START=22 /DNA_END=174 /DNA_ORIENTATION=+
MNTAMALGRSARIWGEEGEYDEGQEKDEEEARRRGTEWVNMDASLCEDRV